MGVGGLYATVQRIQIVLGGGVVADAIQDGDKLIVGLAIHLTQLDRHNRHGLPHFGVKEISRRVEGLQQLSVVVLQHRLQLVDIAHQQQLFATKRLGGTRVRA